MKKHDNNILNSSVHVFFCFNFKVAVFYFVCPTRRIHFFLLMVHKSKQKFRPNPIIYREILFVSVSVFVLCPTNQNLTVCLKLEMIISCLFLFLFFSVYFYNFITIFKTIFDDIFEIIILSSKKQIEDDNILKN